MDKDKFREMAEKIGKECIRTQICFDGFEKALSEAYAKGREDGRKCSVCGGTDVVCYKGVQEQRNNIKDEFKRIGDKAFERGYNEAVEDCKKIAEGHETNKEHDKMHFNKFCGEIIAEQIERLKKG